MAYIETKTDEDKKALLRACANLTKECIGADCQTLWAHHSVADRRSGRLLIQLQSEDKDALAIVRAADRMFDNIRDEVALELQALRPLRDFGWDIRVQKCEFRATLDDIMDGIRARRGDDYNDKSKGYAKHGKYGKYGKGYEEEEDNGTGNDTASSTARWYGRAPEAASSEGAWRRWKPPPPPASTYSYDDGAQKQKEPH